MKFRKRHVLFLLSATVIFGLASITPASSQTSASTSTLSDGGVLRLKLGATDEWRFQPTAGDLSDNTTQSVTSAGGCGLNAASLNGPLVKLTAENGSVGFVADGFGVRGTGEGTGQPCGRIDGNQKLSVELGSKFTPATGTKRIADFAEIDIEGKFDARFTITGTFGSSTKTESYDTAAGGSDSGPDSGDGDNFRIRFPKTGKFLFSKLTFAPTSGAVSVEGGADGTRACTTQDSSECTFPVATGTTGSLGQQLGTMDSLFHLIKFDRTLNCGESETQSGGTTVPTNTLERLANDGGPDCAAVPIDLDASIAGSDQLVSLRKDLTGQATAQFSWTVTWTPEVTTLPVKVTQFDFGAGYQAIQWCLADDGDADSFPERPPTASTDDDPSAVDPWCLTSQHSDLDNATGKITVKEIYFGIGDPGAKR